MIIYIKLININNHLVYIVIIKYYLFHISSYGRKIIRDDSYLH